MSSGSGSALRGSPSSRALKLLTVGEHAAGEGKMQYCLTALMYAASGGQGKCGVDAWARLTGRTRRAPRRCLPLPAPWAKVVRTADWDGQGVSHYFPFDSQSNRQENERRRRFFREKGLPEDILGGEYPPSPGGWAEERCSSPVLSR